ncbi:MAG: hypothetical protein M3P30_09475 [Chloroflexota bacterium]|nr:hypothetical protein [Chloroflexota bacterium]
MTLTHVARGIFVAGVSLFSIVGAVATYDIFASASPATASAQAAATVCPTPTQQAVTQAAQVQPAPRVPAPRRVAMPVTGNAGLLPGSAAHAVMLQAACPTAVAAPTKSPISTTSVAPTPMPVATVPPYNAPGGGGGIGGGIGGGGYGY